MIANIPVLQVFDGDEPVCARDFGDKDGVCRFLLLRKFGTQPVCGFGEHQDLWRKTSRGFIKPNERCPVHIYYEAVVQPTRGDMEFDEECEI